MRVVKSSGIRARGKKHAAVQLCQASELAVGSRVRVKASVHVYHAKGQKGAAVDLEGREGVVKARADYQNGRKIVSATLPLKVHLEGDPEVIAHVKEEEVELLDQTPSSPTE